MATPFDSFNRSPLDVFIQSPLLARGAPSGGSFSRTAALSFAITPTPSYVKYPQYSLFIPSTRFIQRYQNSGGSLVFLDEFTLAGGGDMLVGAGKSGTLWRIERARTSVATVPASAPASAYWRVRVRASNPPNGIAADIYMAHESSACTFNGPASGWYLGKAIPNVDNYFNPGALIPGQRYYLFFQGENDWSYMNISNTQFYQFHASNNGTAIRLETFI